MKKPNKLIKSCEICIKSDATCLCYECNSYFCERCFKVIHDIKYDPIHKKEKIDFFVPIELKCSEHPKDRLNLFCIDDKEACCSIYLYDNIHKDHKLVELEDIENLKKENITTESVADNFVGIYNKIVDLKNLIEKEINKIDYLYQKTMEDLTETYMKRHQILLNEENELKEKLQFEVTKTKEKLEDFLSTSNHYIKLSERIKKGIEKMKYEEENIIKILSYVSKANKTKKEMINLSQQFMKNIKFNYIEDKNEITYEDYYFNGIRTPENFQIKYINYSSFNIYGILNN